MIRVKLPAVFKSALVAAVVSVAALSSDASAQQQQPRAQETQSPAAARDTQAQRAGGAAADVSITARVTAAEVRFEKVPSPRVDFTGKPERVTVWEAERENLPPQVQPGVTYRNIGITLRITSVFADIDRIVAEALGEIPAGDEAQPIPAQPPAQPPVTPPARPSDAPPAPATAPPANSVTSAPRRRPAQRGRGK